MDDAFKETDFHYPGEDDSKEKVFLGQQSALNQIMSRKDRIEASNDVREMLGLAQDGGADTLNSSSRSISKLDLSINNYDKSINSISRTETRAPTWKQSLSKNRRRRVSTVQDNDDFHEGVAHILDRSHVKYKVVIDDNYTIESEQAKKRINVNKKLMKLLGPSKFNDYQSD
mmetsp:Transcript_3598/g.3552  ORF Transcript_3598/g.3552 Transcript_3598/m.3552 type:complete len:172 (+) Transcript_3598:239-754(+)